ncbi:MAG: ribbon-helix-helix protein, CopG family [Acidimicrobiia bacterium]
MRTTLAVDDELLAAAKRRARQRGLTLGQFVEDAIRQQLTRSATPGPRPQVPVFRGGRGVRVGVDVTSNRGLLEALDEGRALEDIR